MPSVEINAGQSFEVAGVKITVNGVTRHSEGDGPPVQRVSLSVEPIAAAVVQEQPKARARTNQR
jgi:hypothetical protein